MIVPDVFFGSIRMSGLDVKIYSCEWIATFVK